MSRLIFTIYDEVSDDSVTDFKKTQLKKYYDVLTNKQFLYAEKCKADYKIVSSNKNKYDDIQFSKINFLKEFTEEYKEVLYLDLDVIPSSKCNNIFDEYDFNNLVCFYEDCEKRMFNLFPKPDEKYKYIHKLDHMSWWVKMAAKNSMLMLDDYPVSDYIINTGVLGASYDIIHKIQFEERLDYMTDLLEEAKNDNLYPPETSLFFKPNNEVFFTYLVERKEIPSVRIDEKWNYILDDIRKEWTNDVNFFHVINKEFNLLENV